MNTNKLLEFDEEFNQVLEVAICDGEIFDVLCSDSRRDFIRGFSACYLWERGDRDLKNLQLLVDRAEDLFESAHESASNPIAC